LKLIDELVNDYQPYAMVGEDYAKASRRCRRIEGLIDDISNLATKSQINVRSFSRAEVRRAFAESGAKTKYELRLL
jgi:hypothetical protein